MARLRDYEIDDSALDEIDADWKAYFLGLLMADGSIRGNRVTLKLHKDDAYVLDDLRERLHLTRPLTVEGSARTLYFASERIGQALNKYGMVRGKTARLGGIPLMPPEMVPHFVRGFFDGDGTASMSTAKPHALYVSICSVCEGFLIAVQRWLQVYLFHHNL